MLHDDILQAAGFVPGKTYRHARFTQPPTGKRYAVYTDDITNLGPDDRPSRIRRHEVTVEIYASVPDDEGEATIEAALDAEGLDWTKQDRYWIPEAQRYQTIYEFTYIEKRR